MLFSSSIFIRVTIQAPLYTNVCFLYPLHMHKVAHRVRDFHSMLIYRLAL